MTLYRFGSCRLDAARRQLLRDGIDRPLTPKAFDLLRVLIDARPRVLSKAEIMDFVWPDAYVSEANVAILVGDIRAAIGDSAREPALVRTHHGLGYSFCGEVIEMVRQSVIPLGRPLFLLAIGERKVVLPSGTSTVGRDVACDVVIPDASVSRRHARFVIDSDNAHVEDLGSKNGTRVEGRRVDRPVDVGDGSELRFGTVHARVIVADAGERSTLTIETSE